MDEYCGFDGVWRRVSKFGDGNMNLSVGMIGGGWELRAKRLPAARAFVVGG